MGLAGILLGLGLLMYLAFRGWSVLLLAPMAALIAAAAAFEPLLAHSRHLHARGARPGHTISEMARNTIDFARIVSRLKAIGYSGAISTEYVWLSDDHPDRVDSVAETLAVRDLLRSCLT